MRDMTKAGCGNEADGRNCTLTKQNLPLTTQRPPPQLDILTYPCVLDSVLQHSSDATLATLLRTCRYLFDRAGKLLYQEITLKDEISPPVLSGASFSRPPSLFTSPPRSPPCSQAPAPVPVLPAAGWHTKNALLRYVRKATFHLDGSCSNGVRRALEDGERICLPGMHVCRRRSRRPLSHAVRLGRPDGPLCPALGMERRAREHVHEPVSGRKSDGAHHGLAGGHARHGR